MRAYELVKHGMMVHSEIDLLAECVRTLPSDAVVVNIGAGFGTSTAVITELRPNAYIFSVDIYAVEREKANLELLGLPTRRVTRLLGRSQEIGQNWPFRIDMLFVDGSHRYSNVVADIQAWTPSLVKGGMLVFHDYAHPKESGVTRAVDELIVPYYEPFGQSRYLIAFVWEKA